MSSESEQQHEHIEAISAPITSMAHTLLAAGYDPAAVGHALVSAGVNTLAASGTDARQVSRILYLLASQYARDADRAEGAPQH